jgi:hypothetical protein
MQNNSLLIVTWDEGGFDQDFGQNHIPTVFFGPMVVPGNYDFDINHYNVLRTLQDMYGLGHIENTIAAAPITTVWAPEPTAVHLAATAATILTIAKRPWRYFRRRGSCVGEIV